MNRPEPAPDPRYEDVRRRLLDRGYLEGHVERFLLREFVTPGRGPRRLLGTAIRAAAIGGPMLGALLAGAAAMANRPLSGPVDLFLLWIYFTPLAAGMLVLVDLVAASVAVALVRRRGARSGDPFRAAAIVGVPTLIYLLVLWSRRRPTGDLVPDLVFLLTAVGITLVVTWLAGMVSLAGIIGRTGQVPDRNRRLATLLLLVVVPPGALVFLALALGGEADPQADPSPFATREAQPALVIGVDGLDGELLARFEPRGALAGLLSRLGEGAVHPVSREVEAEPAEVWTTIMTGVTAESHGIRDAGAERLPGVATPLVGRSGPLPLIGALRFLLPTRTVPTTGVGRSVRTLWEIVALRSPTMAIGWWTSWPAIPESETGSGGYIVSDRVLPKLLSAADPDRDTAPESLYARLRSEFASDRDLIRDQFDSEFESIPTGAVSRLVWESYLIDAYRCRLALRLLDDRDLLASFVYLPGLDILRTRIERIDDGAQPTAETRRDVVVAYLRGLDRLLTPLLAAETRQVILVADRGRGSSPDAEGFVLVRSRGVPGGCVGEAIRPVDVAPLVLDLVGFPATSEMPGAVPGSCNRAGSELIPRIPTYGRRERLRSDGVSEYDPEMVERLKSLGYLN